MRKKRWIAWILSVVLVVTGLNGYPLVAASEENKDPLTENIFYRVMDKQEGNILQYHYEDGSGNEIVPKGTIQNSFSNRSQAAQSVIPDSYDPRGTEAETPIRDQEDTGACWAFGALKSLEGNAIAQGLYTTEEADFSENHLAWYTYNHLQDTTNPLYGDYWNIKDIFGADIYDIGGNALFATFILANGWGAAAESDAPFATGAAMAAEMELKDDSFRNASIMRLTDSECYDDASSDTIKQKIMENGAMNVSLYYPDTSAKRAAYMYQDEDVCSLYQNKYDADYANHSVTIVGWDDDFDTFQQEPEASGAWLIANSYGEEYNDQGYFWVSYYDTSLCEFYSFEGTATDTYTTAFQYDGFGWGDGFASTQDIRLANVFTNETEEPQQLSAAAFYTFADGQSYEINVYRNLGEDGPDDGDWVGRCTTEGIADYSGYHTIDLTEPISVAPGEKFSVIVTFHPNTGSAYALIEGKNEIFSDIRHAGSAGESYVYFAESGKWYDTGARNYNNVCVKAFANPITEEEYVEQEKTYAPSDPTLTPTLYPTATQQPGSNVSGGDSGGSAATVPSSGGTNRTDTSSGRTTGSGTASDGASGTMVKKISSTSKIVMGKGEKVKLSVTTKPSAGKNTLTYKSSNTKIVRISKTGTVTAKKTGSAKITIQAPSGVKKTVKIKVKKAPKSLKVTAKKTTLRKGKTTKLKVKLNSGSASYHLKYQSMNKRILSVTKAGKVKAKKVGVARIRVKTFNDKKAFIKIKVVA